MNVSLQRRYLVSDSDVQRVDVAGVQLFNAYKTAEGLLANDPQKLQELKDSITAIKNNFSQILNIKYGLTAQAVVDSLSPEQVDSLVAQCNALTSQMNSITSEITAKTLAVTQLQNQVTLETDTTQLDILNQQLQAAQAELDDAKNRLYAVEDRLKDLKDKLDVSQANLAQAVQFFDSLVGNEKALFQELFPGVTFPV